MSRRKERALDTVLPNIEVGEPRLFGPWTLSPSPSPPRSPASILSVSARQRDYDSPKNRLPAPLGKKRGATSLKAKPIAKEQSIFANHRFIILDEQQKSPDDVSSLSSPDYLVVAAADVIVPWKQIQAVIVRISSNHANPLTCPICLDVPTAPRFTRCGHLFCYTCLLQFVALGEGGKWRPCPICYEPIRANELKCVRFEMITDYYVAKFDSGHNQAKIGPNERLKVQFTLMRRQGDSLDVMPVFGECKTENYSKLVSVTRKWLCDNIYQPELTELESMSVIDQSSLPFIEMACHDLRGKLSIVDSCDAMPSNIPFTKQKSSPPPSKFFYFYQASDGQHLFLNALNIKMLRHQFGEYSEFPAKLLTPLVALESFTLNAELRRRCKYLSHLSLGCQITFAEVDLSSIVSVDTLATFRKEIELRKQQRAAKEYVENQHAIAIDARNAAQQQLHYFDETMGGSPFATWNEELNYESYTEDYVNFPAVGSTTTTSGGIAIPQRKHADMGETILSSNGGATTISNTISNTISPTLPMVSFAKATGSPSSLSMDSSMKKGKRIILFSTDNRRRS